MSSAVEDLAGAAVGIHTGPLPAEVLAAATTAWLDWVGVAAAGRDGVMTRALRVATAGSDGPCAVFGGAPSVEASAALVNGTAAHTLELDDIYGPGLFHPGAPVIAAALAVAQHERASGEELLRAVVAGYEVGDRIAERLGPAHYRHFHTTGTAGALGAAAAAACLAGLDVDGVSAALAISATMAAGLQQTFRTGAVAKPLHAGHAAHAGVLSARAAQHGGEGAPDVLDGAVGLGQAMSDGPQWGTILDGLGEPFLITRTTTKPYPCCGHTFAAIDAARLLVADGVRADDVRCAQVRTYRAAVDVAGIAAPRTVAEARFSTAFAVAAALRDGNVTLRTFTGPSLDEPGARRLTARTTVVEDDVLTRAAPARRGAVVTVTLDDGRTLTRTVPDRFGSPENPMTPAQLRDKCEGLLAERADLWPRLHAVAGLADVRDLPL